MGWLDKLRGREHAAPSGYPLTKGAENPESLPGDASRVTGSSAVRRPNMDVSKCLKLPFGDIAALGAVFGQMIPAFRTFSMDGGGYMPVNMKPGDRLRQAKDGSFYGSHKTPDGNFKFTKWEKVDSVDVTLPVNPSLILMAAMLADIEKKLDAIEKTQAQILSFLEQDKQAEQQGNLNMLIDMLSGYKFNWDNDQYRINHHMKALDIKQTAEKNILFYQEQIEAAVRRIPAVYLDQAVGGLLDEWTKLFKNYRTAVYSFAFSSLLEVLLLGNFQQSYLDQVAEKTRRYRERYQVLFAQCRDRLRTLSGDSVESKLLSGIGNANRALGRLIASAPVLGQGAADKWLEESGEKLLKDTDAKGERLGAFFSANEEPGSEVFEDSIRDIGTIRNRTRGIVIRGDALYLDTGAAL